MAATPSRREPRQRSQGQDATQRQRWPRIRIIGLMGLTVVVALVAISGRWLSPVVAFGLCYVFLPTILGAGLAMFEWPNSKLPIELLQTGMLLGFLAITALGLSWGWGIGCLTIPTLLAWLTQYCMVATAFEVG